MVFHTEEVNVPPREENRIAAGRTPSAFRTVGTEQVYTKQKVRSLCRSLTAAQRQKKQVPANCKIHILKN